MNHRRGRVASELRQQLAVILAQRVRDPRLAAVTVVEVRPSPDFSFARVFYRAMGDPAEAARALVQAKPFLRRCLAEVSGLRVVPELDWRLDSSPERAARMDELLDEVAARRSVAELLAAEAQGGGEPEPGEGGAPPQGSDEGEPPAGGGGSGPHGASARPASAGDRRADAPDFRGVMP